MKVLVINTGSSSIKYQLFNMDNKTAIATGLVEKIGEAKGKIKHKISPVGGESKEVVLEQEIKDHKVGLSKVVELLIDKENGVIKNKSEVDAIGHRTVHGGEVFNASVRIDSKVVDAMKAMIPLAPLHNPANLIGIEVATEIFPNVPQVGVFDTAFHQTMPASAFRYAIPEELYTKHHVRRYGFHGTSHRYVSKEAAKFLKKDINETNLITVHIGNGASVAAIKNGKSIDTSMGMTPLEGLVMGTRSGDIDPAIPHFLVSNLKMSIDQVNNVLNKDSGMKGISGSNDLRDVEERYIAGNDDKAKLAIEMYAYRIKKYIGAYYAALGRVDAIVFTAGVGENSPIIRELSCRNLENMGIEIDKNKNEPRSKDVRDISVNGSKVKVLVVPTNEELEIALQTVEVLK